MDAAALSTRMRRRSLSTARLVDSPDEAIRCHNHLNY
jgi:hypothetical protein